MEPRVELDLLGGGSSLVASVPEVLPDDVLVSAVLTECLERLRMLRSFMNDGIASGDGQLCDAWLRGVGCCREPPTAAYSYDGTWSSRPVTQ